MKCNHDSCTNSAFASGLCKSHLNHIKRYGETRDLRGTNRVYIDSSNCTAKLVLYDVHRKPFKYAIVDINILPKLKNIYLSYDGSYARVGTSKGRKVYLHHIVIGRPEGSLVVDHINRDKLDNRLCNLRFVTKSENNKNRQNI